MNHFLESDSAISMKRIEHCKRALRRMASILLFICHMAEQHTYQPPMQKEAKFLEPKEHSRVRGDTRRYVSLKGLSQVQCVGHCTLTDNCHSVNYHGDDQICLVIDEIFDDESDGGESHLVNAPGWTFFKKTRLTPKVIF